MKPSKAAFAPTCLFLTQKSLSFLCRRFCRTGRPVRWVSFGRASDETTKRQRAKVAVRAGPNLWYESALKNRRGSFGGSSEGEVDERAREREWRPALRGARTLLRYQPPWRRYGSRPPVG